jgi:pyrroloquinoline quinone biosynthesis protein D
MSEQAMIPRLNPMFRFQYEQAQSCHVLLFPEGMVKLNDSASEIIQLIDGNSSVQQIVKLLAAKFPDAGDLSDDVAAFLITAVEKKWIYYGH